MGTRFRSALATSAAVLAVGATALAQSVHEIVAGGDTVSGTVDSSTDVDRIPFRLVEGATVSLSVKAAKGSTLLPQVTILALDRTPDAAFGASLVTAKKGNAVAAKNFVIAETGLRWLEVRGANGTTGGWIVAFKVKLAKGAVVEAVAPAAANVDLSFVNPGNATAAFSAAPSKGSTAIPTFVSLRDPDSLAITVDDLRPGPKGFQAVGVYMPKTGDHALRVAASGAGGVTLKAKWKVPKPLKRALLESQVITDPILESVSPTGGDTAQIVPVVLVADFLEAGAKAVFRRSPTVVTVQGTAVTVNDAGMTFNINLQSFQKGVYDVEVENADGGKSVLLLAFSVANAPARPTSLSPTSGFDNEVKRLTVSGSFLHSQSTLALVRSGDSIPGTAQTGAGTLLQADFDLRDRAHGLWDLVVTNPDAAPSTLAAAFELINAQPVLLSITPPHNLDGVVAVCTILGTDIDAPPVVTLRRPGESDIAGTSVVRVSGGEVTANFDTTGAAVGAWDVVLSNPDGQSAMLAGAFRVSGIVGPRAKSLNAAGEAHGPVSVAYNPTRDEFAAAWVDEGSGSWSVVCRRLDAEGTPLASAVTVSTSSSSVAKRDAVVAWDKDHDEYLVAWSEKVSANGLNNPATKTHPSAGYSSFDHIFAQRLKGSDLTTLGSLVKVIDSTTDFPAGSGWLIEDFNNFRASMIWNPVAQVWTIGWTQEWDTSASYSADDYDVMYRPLDRSGVLGTITGVASGSEHEGDLELAWDPNGQRILVAYSGRPSVGGLLTLYVGTGGGAGAAVTDASSSLADPRMAVDTDSGRLLLTWTRNPGGGAKSVEATVFPLSNLTARVGAVVSVGAGSGTDHLLARPLYNTELGQGFIAWTRVDGSSGDLSVRLRHADTGDASGLVLVGTESEVSGGSGDEGAPTVVTATAAGDTVIFWLKTLSLATNTNHIENPVGGTWRGAELWLQRYQ